MGILCDAIYQDVWTKGSIPVSIFLTVATYHSSLAEALKDVVGRGPLDACLACYGCNRCLSVSKERNVHVSLCFGETIRCKWLDKLRGHRRGYFSPPLIKGVGGILKEIISKTHLLSKFWIVFLLITKLFPIFYLKIYQIFLKILHT